jgi:competence protein ComEA
MQQGQFNIEDFVLRNRIAVVIFLIGVGLLGAAILVSKQFVSSANVEVLQGTTEAQETNSEIVVEVAGEVVNSGVYKLSSGSRIEDALTVAGGFSEDADRQWVEKNLNRAAKLSDGTKIYIPAVNEQSTQSSASNNGVVQTVSPPRGSGLVNINTASQSGLEELPGIGPVYAQSIIEHRPYSTVEELLSSGALKKSTYEKVKDLVSTF